MDERQKESGIKKQRHENYTERETKTETDGLGKQKQYSNTFYQHRFIIVPD